MSADLRGCSDDTPATGDQPHPADQPHGGDQRPVPPADSQAAGAEARRQKYAHLTEGTSQASPGPDRPARPADQPTGANQRPVPPVAGQAAGEEARRQKYAHLTEGTGQVTPRRGPAAQDAGETAQASSPEARQPGTRPPEAHVLTDRRYPTLEDYQKTRHVRPPGEHDSARHPQNADHGPPGSPAGSADHGRAAGQHAHGRHDAGEPRSTSPADADLRGGSGGGTAEVPAEDGGNPPEQPHVTHYQASFRGEQLDLWTDGDGHWASDYKRADDALPVDHVADVRTRMPGSHDGPAALPETVYVDGREVQVTHDPEEGVWFGGMGEVPEAPDGDPNGTGHAGEVFDGGYEKSKSAEVKATLWSKGETVNDVAENVTDEVGRLFDHPQGKAEVGAHAHPDGMLQTGVDHGMDVPDAAKAVLAAGLLTWEITRLAGKGIDKMAEWMRGARHARD